MVKRLPVTRETWVQFLDQEDPLEKAMAPHSSSPPWKIPWTEEPGSLQSMGVTKSQTRLSNFTFFLFFLSFNLTKWMGSYYKILVIPQSACLSPSARPSVAGCSPVADRCCTFRRKGRTGRWLGLSQRPQVFCLASLRLPLCALPNDTGDGEDWSTSLRCYQLGGCALWGSFHLPACVFPGQVGLLKITSKLWVGGRGAVQALNLGRKH